MLYWCVLPQKLSVQRFHNLISEKPDQISDFGCFSKYLVHLFYNLLVAFELVDVRILFGVNHQFEKNGLVLVVNTLWNHVIFPFWRVFGEKFFHILPQRGGNPEVVLFAVNLLKVAFNGLSELSENKFYEGLSFESNQFVVRFLGQSCFIIFALIFESGGWAFCERWSFDLRNLKIGMSCWVFLSVVTLTDLARGLTPNGWHVAGSASDDLDKPLTGFLTTWGSIDQLFHVQPWDLWLLLEESEHFDWVSGALLQLHFG